MKWGAGVCVSVRVFFAPQELQDKLLLPQMLGFESIGFPGLHRLETDCEMENHVSDASGLFERSFLV